MNLLRDAAVLELQRSNVNVLEATLRQTRDRFRAGEVTRTDVAQSESRLAAGRSQLLTPRSNYVTSKANYRQVVGRRTRQVGSRNCVDRFSPRTLAGSMARARTEHPTITTASYNVDAAAFQVKIAEGALYPTVTLQGTLNKQFGSTTNLNSCRASRPRSVASCRSDLSGRTGIPTIRQAKETPDTAARSRHRARSGAIDRDSGLGQLEAAKAQSSRPPRRSCRRNQPQRACARRPGLAAHHARLLNAQQELVNARVALRHAAAGPGCRLLHRAGGDRRAVAADSRVEGSELRPGTHYHQIRDNWIGVRTPDGR